MAENQHDADIMNADRKRQAALMREHLEKLGVKVSIAHYTGDSSFPTEYTLSYSELSAVGPTFDLAIAEFIERLLKQLQIAQLSRLELELQIEQQRTGSDEEPPDLVAEMHRRIDSPHYKVLGEDEPYYHEPEESEG